MILQFYQIIIFISTISLMVYSLITTRLAQVLPLAPTIAYRTAAYRSSHTAYYSLSSAQQSKPLQTSYEYIFQSIPELQQAHDRLCNYLESIGEPCPLPNQYELLARKYLRDKQIAQQLKEIRHIMQVYRLAGEPTEPMDHKEMLLQGPGGQLANVVGLSVPSASIQIKMIEHRAQGTPDSKRQYNQNHSLLSKLWKAVKNGFK
ncbi:hypothetical protein BATDEDRAFT_86445 [Batrachochytrium dendrobatidis JAM81]|uniref:Uncharacterized protein n=2 Tax=Batrachochytrium dendrobatidis TaxID=109871 RepID=F4NW60_BATDJ|nr:uncharacterized protein BATDEDRAFT_86445 [Batrachochytrium dendrobatidis JAM81]EGF82775.1 hypothetical protein BATDEDRAFT_86445 [Batrachochytrium dendrobatidis JAM81]OAJ39682.1 hypothetical protein BDEG_23512 [Batrachochytrium dendrobatidis JEL423]|eukprot:XP_006677050.1 hypothetical protein BATDEDRAFT_86445 [Batrachochytrium dendrobatidis JAM81]